MINPCHISEPNTSYYSTYLYSISYCLAPIESIQKRLKEGFIPMGPIFYNAHKKSYYQALIKRKMRAIKNKQKILSQIDEKERQCLALILQEYSHKDISHTLNCSLSSIEKIISNLRKKFNVKKNTGLVREAIRFGLDEYLLS